MYTLEMAFLVSLLLVENIRSAKAKYFFALRIFPEIMALLVISAKRSACLLMVMTWFFIRLNYLIFPPHAKICSENLIMQL